MERWLVSLDTDRVKEYVFASGRLKEIRGASAILDDLNRAETETLITAHGGAKVFAGGGSAMASFDQEPNARAFCEAVEALYRERTTTGAITGITLPFDTDAPFGSVFKDASHRLRRAKDEGRHSPGALNLAWISRCQRCGEYPAVRRLLLPGNTSVGLCAACAAKREAAEDSAIGPVANLKEKAGDVWETLREPDELSEVGQKSTPANYIGFIYADGNGIGKLIETKIGTEEDMRYFSQILEQSIVDAVDAAAGPAVARGLPVVPVLIGGDDVILITPAQVALPVAARLCVEFGRRVADRSREAKEAGLMHFEGDQLEATMSVGVALAKASHPIFALQELARELTTSAKQLSATLRRRGYGLCPSLDFRIISSSSANPWKQVKKRELQLPSTGQVAQEKWATSRPYPCERIPGLNRPTWPDLQEAVSRLHEGRFPRNKLHLWQNFMQSDYSTERIELEVKLLQSRLNARHQALMDEVSQLLHLPGHSDFFLTDPLEPKFALSPLPDIVEVYDFLV